MNKIKIILIGISIILALFIINSSYNILEKFKNTSIDNKERIEKIIHLLNYDKSEFTLDITEDNININYETERVNYKDLEKNASILFYLINGLHTINYQINDQDYMFNYDKVSLIYDDFKDTDIKKINERYKNKYFSQIYLGNINGEFDLFDISEVCLDNYIELARNKDYVYYITCSSLDSVIVINGNIEYTLLEALGKDIINVDDLMNINLKISKEKVGNESIS
ncbi:MAG: hypothetical protein HFI87_03265 [Bacilli bacterium]|nr:hypothetical protein [Bacilli bacterium]